MSKQGIVNNLNQLVSEILIRRAEVLNREAMLVGISGIDASGKGWTAARLAELICQHSLNAVVINIDGWLNLPHIRFSKTNPAQNFYENALRLDEMFARLVLPLKRERSVNIKADVAEEIAAKFRPHVYSFRDADIILLEGIFLFKEKYQPLFDVKIWIECSFGTALTRALRRGQEGLPPDETVKAYETIYFPAQRIHFETDKPKQSVDIIFDNDNF